MNASVRPFAWNSFQFEIPADWEVTGYRVEEADGRFEFSTRHGFQAAVSWEPCKVFDPVAALQARPRPPGKGARAPSATSPVTVREAGPFRLGVPSGSGEPCQAVCHLADPKQLLRWVFADASDAAVERCWRPLLATFHPNAGPMRRIAAFGLDVRLPMGYALQDLTALPAHVAMTFEAATKARLTVRRWGLPERVLDGKSLEGFLTILLQVRGCRPGSPRATTFRGCPAVTTEYEQRPEHRLEAMLGRAWTHGEAWLWHNEAEQRLYACEQIGPESAARPAVADVFGGPAAEVAS